MYQGTEEYKSPISKVFKRKSSSVSIKLDEETIRTMAYELSQQNLSWDDYVWLLAESELRLLPAFENARSTPSSLVELGGMVQIFPSRVVSQPSEDDIRDLAGKIASFSPRMDELHWFIAERNFILDHAVE